MQKLCSIPVKKRLSAIMLSALTAMLTYACAAKTESCEPDASLSCAAQRLAPTTVQLGHAVSSALARPAGGAAKVPEYLPSVCPQSAPRYEAVSSSSKGATASLADLNRDLVVCWYKDRSGVERYTDNLQ